MKTVTRTLGTTVHRLVVRALSFDEAMDSAMATAQGSVTSTWRRCKVLKDEHGNEQVLRLSMGTYRVWVVVQDKRPEVRF